MNRTTFAQERQSLAAQRKTKAQITLKTAVAAVIATGRTVSSQRAKAVEASSVNWQGKE